MKDSRYQLSPYFFHISSLTKLNSSGIIPKRCHSFPLGAITSCMALLTAVSLVTITRVSLRIPCSDRRPSVFPCTMFFFRPPSPLNQLAHVFDPSAVPDRGITVHRMSAYANRLMASWPDHRTHLLLGDQWALGKQRQGRR